MIIKKDRIYNITIYFIFITELIFYIQRIINTKK